MLTLPRYKDLPTFMIYSDQLLEVVDRALEPFLPLLGVDARAVSASMVNNYVKAGIMPKPVKKKYSRNHVATLLVIALMKEVFSLDEIKRGLALAERERPLHEAYDAFCEATEREYRHVFSGKGSVEDPGMIDLACRALATKLYVRYQLDRLECAQAAADAQVRKVENERKVRLEEGARSCV